jgi:hypothetical protein
MGSGVLGESVSHKEQLRCSLSYCCRTYSPPASPFSPLMEESPFMFLSESAEPSLQNFVQQLIAGQIGAG